jgi:hypothetical protein
VLEFTITEAMVFATLAAFATNKLFVLRGEYFAIIKSDALQGAKVFSRAVCGLTGKINFHGRARSPLVPTYREK